MPTTHAGPVTQRARHGEPQPAPLQTNMDEPISTRRDLKSWWKNFSRGNQKREDEKVAQPTGIFGIPLQTSVRYANVAISLQDAEGHSYVYGYVPIVVAKCGVFLKEKATDVEGIFRLSGSEKRIKELKEAFNSPDRYGKGLDWTGYTVHDAANILRRYFNQLPEPIIPLEFYERFRDPLRNHQSQAVGQIEGQSPATGDFDHQKTIRIYQQLITELPPLNRQLLLYILDLLAVFASKSDLNKMTTPNLAAIFQPGILSHPSHDMAPPEYRLSQDVLIFLIENQDHFLIGMPGTGADEKTKQDVESGPPTPSVGRAPKSLLGRSSSGASKYSGMRRSVSVSSKQSASIAPSPISPTPHTPTTSGVHRSNTVPSKHSPRPPPARFQRDQPSETPSPVATPMYTPAEMPGAFPDIGEAVVEAEPAATVPTLAPPGVISPSPPEATPALGNLQPIVQETSKQQMVAQEPSSRPDAIEIPAQARTMSLPPGQETPTGSSRLVALFGGKPVTPSAEGAPKRNKLQKKRLQGSANPSAQSSSHSLADAPNNEQMSIATSTASNAPLLPGQSSVQQTPTNTNFLQPPSTDSTPLKPVAPVGLKPDPPMSPANSYRSHSEFTEGELDDVQPLDYQGPADVTSDREADQADTGKKRRFWRRKGDSVSYASHSPSPNVEAQRSRSSVLSGGDGNRKSLTLDRNTTLSDPESGDNHRDSKPMSWFKGKLAERAERKEEKDRMRYEAKEDKMRAKSPPLYGEFGHSRGISQSIQSLGAATAAANAASGIPGSGFSHEDGSLTSPPMADVPLRGKSMDLRRNGRSMDVPREHVREHVTAMPKQSMDAGVSGTDFAPAALSAASAATAEVGASPEASRRGVLNVGEEATAMKAAQIAASHARPSP